LVPSEIWTYRSAREGVVAAKIATTAISAFHGVKNLRTEVMKKLLKGTEQTIAEHPSGAGSQT
jgi:hypothetical protein